MFKFQDNSSLAKWKLWLVVGLLLISFDSNAERSTDKAHASKLVGQQFKILIVETAYPYKLSKYAPPMTIAFVREKAAISYETPEDALISFFSSMNAKDFQWNSETWTDTSLRGMEARDLATKTSPDDWVAGWEKSYVGRQIELVSRIEYAKYVLIEYRMLPRSPNEKVFEDTLALTQENGRWKLTQELAADPMLTYWKTPNNRVQVAPNSLFNK
jgi:hypothetical protein